MAVGIALILFMMFGWFGTVIRESLKGNYNKQVDTSFRMGMMWFIFSEVMFFAAFFGALFYARALSVPWLGGEGHGALTNYLPLAELLAGVADERPGQHRRPVRHDGAVGHSAAQHAAAALVGRHDHDRAPCVARRQSQDADDLPRLTIILGFTFLGFQAHEYIEAYTHLNLTLGSGVYGSTFFMLTGFHGLHVTLGAIMLTVIWLRCAKGHFTKEHHFAFEAVAWYWHFVDVVWLGLFMFVYVL